MRRVVTLLFALIAALANAQLDARLLEERVRNLEQRLGGGRIGVSVYAVSHRPGQDIVSTWAHRGDERFAMQSVFKLPLGVAVMQEVRAGRLRLDESLVLRRRDLSIPISSINRRFRGESMRFTVQDLLMRAVHESDNTAADVLMRKIGGPARVTRAVRNLGLEQTRIDRYETELNTAYSGLGPFRPEWAQSEAIEQALAALPESRKAAAMRRWLADPRDTTTPNEMVRLMREVGIPGGRAAALRPFAIPMAPNRRMAAGLPPNSVKVQRTGTGRRHGGVIGVVNDVLLAKTEGRTIVIATFLSGFRGTYAEADRIHAEVASAVDSAVR